MATKRTAKWREQGKDNFVLDFGYGYPTNFKTKKDLFGYAKRQGISLIDDSRYYRNIFVKRYWIGFKGTSKYDELISAKTPQTARLIYARQRGAGWDAPIPANIIHKKHK
jgi:hypothetical protein